MFVLDPEAFGGFDLANAKAFVDWWRRHYPERVSVLGTTARIDYFREIEPSRPLTAERVRRLLRWKDQKMLTHVILTGPNAGQPNLRVTRVLEGLRQLNRFRARISEREFMAWATSVFPTAWVWRLFLAHMARPIEYPIIDQHVLRAYRCQTGDTTSLDWATYNRYRTHFESIVAASLQHGNTQLAARKNVDDALFAYGQFLNQYWPKDAQKHDRKARAPVA